MTAPLGYVFRDPGLLREALTHRSFAHEAGGPSSDYERLEFLGDAVLGFVVADELMKSDPGADEGTLTRRKQRVVAAPVLAEAARRLGLGERLRLGRGELGTGGRNKPSLLADAFEAVLGAVYRDGGLRAARAFVRRHLGGPLRAADPRARGDEDFKTRLQETSQSRWRLTPAYRTVSASGPAHQRVFEVEVHIGARAAGRGRGASRKAAEQDAARDAFEAWGGGMETFDDEP